MDSIISIATSVIKNRKMILPAIAALIISVGVWHYKSVINENEILKSKNIMLSNEVSLRKEGKRINDKIKKEVRQLSDDDFIDRRSRWLR